MSYSTPGALYQSVRIVGGSSGGFVLHLDDDPNVSRWFARYDDALLAAVGYLAAAREGEGVLTAEPMPEVFA